MQSKETHTANTHHDPSNPPTNPVAEWRWGKKSLVGQTEEKRGESGWCGSTA